MKRHSVILTRVLLGLAVATGLLYAAANASAQHTSVTVPFAFTANHEYMPAGFYEVQMMSDRFMALRNTVTRDTQVFMVHPTEGQILESPGRLVFVRVGQQFHLNQVWIAGKSMHSELVVQHKADLELARGRTADSTVELAFNK
jgi:hypothetical protein